MSSADCVLMRNLAAAVEVDDVGSMGNSIKAGAHYNSEREKGANRR